LNKDKPTRKNSKKQNKNQPGSQQQQVKYTPKNTNQHDMGSYKTVAARTKTKKYKMKNQHKTRTAPKKKVMPN